MFTRHRLLLIVKVCVVLPLGLRGLYWTALMDGSRLRQFWTPAPVASPTVPARLVTLWQPPVPDQKLIFDKNGTNAEVFSQLVKQYAFVPAHELKGTLLTHAQVPHRMHLYLTRHTADGTEVTELEIRNIEHVHWDNSAPKIALLAAQ